MNANFALKTASRRRRFDEIAICINDRVDDPSKAGVDRYVGLEHLEPDSLRIRRWGSPMDVEATKLRFRKGDVIFGRRRAYQRKIAVADFEGICSAHAMVLRARPDVALPEFLPFFMQSDLFMERALAISVGSLSPTINWKTLANEEFVLPTLEEQGAIVDLLKAADSVVEAARACAEAAETLAVGVIDRLLLGQLTELPRAASKGLSVEDWQETTLGSLCVLGNGHGFRPKDWAETGLPIIRIQNVRGSKDFNFYSGNPDPTWLVEPGELLFAWAGVPGVSFGPGIWSGPRAVLNQHIYRVTPQRNIEIYWLFEVLRHLTPLIERRAHGFKTSLLHIRKVEFTSQRVLLPPAKQREIVCERMREMRRGEELAVRRLGEARNLRARLLESALESQK